MPARGKPDCIRLDSIFIKKDSVEIVQIISLPHRLPFGISNPLKFLDNQKRFLNVGLRTGRHIYCANA